MYEKELTLTAFDSLCRLVCGHYKCEECPLSIKIDVGHEQISICDFLWNAIMQNKDKNR